MSESPTAAAVRPAAETIARAVADLQALFGERLSTNATVRDQHANSLTWTVRQPPDAVIWPETTEEVAAAVRICARHRVPVIPFGTGTSFEGHVNAPFGGVSIDTGRMKAITAYSFEDQDITVEPGVTRTEVNDYLRDQGLFFPIDPGADASIGGMTATRASGTNAVRYGTMRDNVLALEVVLPSGEIITTARRARKSSAGYDLTRLFVGSEGTLGVITKITLRLHGQPESISSGVCPFPSVRAACDTAIGAIQAGLPVARVELVDALCMRGFNVHSGMAMPETPMLFVEFHGSEAGVAEQAARFGEIAESVGGGPFEWAGAEEERQRLWQARHNAYWAALALKPGATAMSTDVCVPISRLAECVEATQADIEAAGLIAPIVGHVGDGNFHVLPLMDPNDAAERDRVAAFSHRLVERALAMEGTCTGEHGIGQGKRKYLAAEHGEGVLAVMRALKAAIDPLGIMNPGKVAG